MFIKLFIFTSALFLSGCSATQLNYQPQEYPDVVQSIDALKKTLSFQDNENMAVADVEIKPDYLKIVSGPFFKASYIHFDAIQDYALHEKKGLIIASIKDESNRILYRLYVQDEEIAKDFIDAVFTLKNHPKELETVLKKTNKPRK